MSKKSNYKQQIVRFKDIDITFDFNKMPSYDREYLKTMVIETINQKSVKNSGSPFGVYYDEASNFSLFNDETMMTEWMSDFVGDWSHQSSHLLHGRKYYLAWTFYKNKV